MTLPYDLNILDVVLLSVIALFTLRGALRGFLDEVAGLVGILGGVWLAGRYYGELGRIFSQYTTSQWVYIVAYVLILCMVMFVISMISRALHSFLKMAYADWINHLAGAAVGGLKGFLICAVMVTLLTYFINDADFIKKSRMIQPIKETIVVFKQFLPEQCGTGCRAWRGAGSAACAAQRGCYGRSAARSPPKDRRLSHASPDRP